MYVKYDAAVHTSEALATQLGALYEMDEAMLICGSLGRAALYAHFGESARNEYDARNETLVRTKTNHARDIDTIGPANLVLPDAQPFPIDATAYQNAELSLIKTGAAWILASEEKRFSAAVDPAVMEPVEIELFPGVLVQTLRPQTHLALTAARGVPRQKDVRARKLLEALLPKEDKLLPDELFAPFKAVAAQPSSRSPISRAASRLYRSRMPEALKPFTNKFVGHA